MRGRAWLWAVALLLGCAGEEPAGFCDSAPVVTWDTFAAGFVLANCRTCHGTSAPDRQGAPLGIDFDDEAATLQHAERILRVATGSDPAMPPGGGTDGDDRYLFEVWIRCGAP